MSGGRALEGIRVLELGQVMAGPFCALQLCDMGADVIKVEPPDGDPTRQMGARAGTDSTCFAAMNRGKRGIVLDLKSAAGRDALVRLAARADIFIENFRPGVMRELGLDYPALSAVNERLIYASISGYGQTGPDRAKGGFDLVAQGASGLMSVTGEPGGPPVKAGVPLTDLGAGLFALAAILAALHHRHRTGRGQYIDTSLLEAGLALSAWEAAEYFAERRRAAAAGIRASVPGAVSGDSVRRRLHHDRRRHGSAVRGSRGAPRASGMERDGGVRGYVGARAEPRRAHRPDRGRDGGRSRRPTGSRRSRPAAFRAGRSTPIPEAFADPQVQSRQMVVELDHPTLGRMRTLGSPIKMSDTPPLVGRRAPLLGEHTARCCERRASATRRLRPVRRLDLLADADLETTGTPSRSTWASS